MATRSTAKTPTSKPSSKSTAKPASTRSKSTSTSARSTTSKTTAAQKTVSKKPAPKKTVPATTAPAPVTAPEANVVMEMKKKEMIEKVTEASGLKRGDAKKAMEATLQILGDALQEGTTVNVPPFGKVAVNRQKEASGAHVIIAKIRRSKAMLGDETGEEEGAEEATSES